MVIVIGPAAVRHADETIKVVVKSMPKVPVTKVSAVKVSATEVTATKVSATKVSATTGVENASAAAVSKGVG